MRYASPPCKPAITIAAAAVATPPPNATAASRCSPALRNAAATLPANQMKNTIAAPRSTALIKVAR